MNRGRGRGGRATGRRGHHQASSDFADSDTTNNPSTPIHSAQHSPHSAPPKGRAQTLDPSYSFPSLSSSAPNIAGTSPQGGELGTYIPTPQRTATFDSSGTAMASNSPALRRASRMFAPSLDGSAADEEAVSKGGHSLRKRARVDYTQEQVEDDLGAYESRNDPAARLSIAPSARGRNKRRASTYDLSGDDSDGSNATKRRRSEKSPTRQRTASARRKQSVPARKSTSDVRDYPDQPSDNEVLDTILVSVPMGVSSDAQSSSPVPSEAPSNSHRSTPSEGSIDPGQVQSPSPMSGEQVALVEQSTTDRGADTIQSATDGLLKTGDGDKLGSSVYGGTEVVPSNHNHVESPEKDTADPTPRSTVKSEIVENIVVSPAPEVSTETATQPITQDTPSPPVASPLQDEAAMLEPTKQETELPTTTSGGITISPTTALSPEKLTAPGHPTAPATGDEAKPRIPISPEADEAQEKAPSAILAPTIEVTPVQPASPPTTIQANGLPGGEPLPSAVNAAETSVPEKLEPHGDQKPLAASEAGSQDDADHLSPYVEGFVAYPSPWTEIVAPDDGLEPSPAPTPVAALSPPEPKSAEDIWDGVQPLKVKDFFTLYRADVASRTENGEPAISMQEFRRLCSQKHQAALDSPPVAPSKKGKKAAPKVTGPARYRKKAQALGANELESAQPTPARSPAAMPDDVDQNEARQTIEEEGQDADPAEREADGGDAEAGDAEDDAEVGDSPVGPGELLKYPKKQYTFPKIRPESDFAEALSGFKTMPTTTLYRVLASTTKALKKWQVKYLKLKQITDDEENAKRRQANDKTIENWDRRQKLDDRPSTRRTFDDSFQRLPAPFEVRGVRAPAPYVDDPLLEHQRAQDRIQAQAHGFMHNNHSSYIGRQRPSEQRWDLDDPDNETRLRERKQTQKAADAAEENVIIEGKRTRKHRILGDQSQEPSRAATPAPGPRQRRRRGAAAAADPANGDAVQSGDAANSPANALAPSAVPQRRGRGKGKLKASQNGSTAPAIHSGLVNNVEDHAVAEKPKTTRKRGRAAAPAEDSFAAEDADDFDPIEQDDVPPKPKRQRTARNRPDPSFSSDIPPTSFYSNPSPADTQADSRPSTSSSTTTVNTAGTLDSSYSLRDRKKRNYAEENDPDFEARPRKRARGVANKTEAQEGDAPKKRGRRGKKAPMDYAYAADDIAEPEPFAPARPGSNIAQFMTTFDAAPSTPAVPPSKKIKIMLKKDTNLVAGGTPRVAIPAHTMAGPVATYEAPVITSAKPAARTTKTPKAAKQQKTPKAATDAGPSESGTSTQDHADGAAEPGEKPYSEMTKSEKMSYSMRLRWARGEMQGAVEKRKSTLAKKAEAKSSGLADPGKDNGGTPQPGTRVPLP